LNNISGIYGLFTQDSFSDEDFLTAAVTEWSLDIMNGCINDIDVRLVFKLMSEAVTEGKRISKLPYNDDRESDDIATYDELMAEAERLKKRIKKA
jgi:predicted Mrr-cat superfamily restriction endonuclease